MGETHLKPGDWVLVQGSGGVSVFALQLARMIGCRVIDSSYPLTQLVEAFRLQESQRHFGKICVNI